MRINGRSAAVAAVFAVVAVLPEALVRGTEAMLATADPDGSSDEPAQPPSRPREATTRTVARDRVGRGLEVGRDC